MKIKLPDSVSSHQDLMAIVLEVKEYLRWFTQASVKKRFSAADNVDPPVISAASMTLINSCNVDKTPLSSKNLDELILALNDIEANSIKVTITLAAPPAGSLKKTIVEWFRKNVDPDILIDFRFNSTILGGMVVSYGSHIFDWSFRRQILAGRERFPEVLRHV